MPVTTQHSLEINVKIRSLPPGPDGESSVRRRVWVESAPEGTAACGSRAGPGAEPSPCDRGGRLPRGLGAARPILAFPPHFPVGLPAFRPLPCRPERTLAWPPGPPGRRLAAATFPVPGHRCLGLSKAWGECPWRQRDASAVRTGGSFADFSVGGGSETGQEVLSSWLRPSRGQQVRSGRGAWDESEGQGALRVPSPARLAEWPPWLGR